MTTISRVDQAILLLKERLRRLDASSTGSATKAGKTARGDRSDPLLPIRQLAAREGVADPELRRALVRTLLADALGEDLVGSLEFQSVADDVARILEESDTGRALIAQALAEL